MPQDIVTSIHDVVLFVGSGVSTENRTVYPDTFYDWVCEDLNISRSKQIPFSKLMSLHCKKFKGKIKLVNKIKDRIDYFKLTPELYSQATKFHKELALLPCVDKIVTTNWDDFFELETHATPFVYPEDLVFWDGSMKKVLKIHGSINNLSSIIATSEDYNKCYKRLKNGIIGSQIKLFLAKNTIIFIGYSFQDEDFHKIYNLVKREMKEYRKQAYIVTVDKKSDANWKKLDLMPIYTDGSYFIHTLRNSIEKQEKCLYPLKNLSGVIVARRVLSESHEKTAKKIDLTKTPEVIYCLYYQDGIFHAIDDMLNKVNYGYTLCSKNVINSMKAYEELVKKYKRHKNWLDHAYLKGYLRGLYIIISNLEKLDETLIQAYYYNAVDDEEYCTEGEFIKSLKGMRGNSQKRKYAEKYIKKMGYEREMVPHHIHRL